MKSWYQPRKNNRIVFYSNFFPLINNCSGYYRLPQIHQIRHHLAQFDTICNNLKQFDFNIKYIDIFFRLPNFPIVPYCFIQLPFIYSTLKN